MGRRSLKEERAEQILEAFERCVADHGLAGATLERVAEYAGLGRPAIRHNVGNREALIEAALERIATRHKHSYAAIADQLPSSGRVEAMLGYLFVGPFSGPADQEDAVLDELFAVRHREPRVAELLDEVYADLQATLARELRREYPGASRARCRTVAYQLMALAFGHSTFSTLDIGARRGPTALRLARLCIVEGLVDCEPEG